MRSLRHAEWRTKFSHQLDQPLVDESDLRVQVPAHTWKLGDTVERPGLKFIQVRNR
jgi:hypothetical protein